MRARRRALPLFPVHHELEWTQELAAAVIRQAIEDVRTPQLPRKHREDAWLFLMRRDERLAVWCSVAGIHIEVVSRRLERREAAT